MPSDCDEDEEGIPQLDGQLMSPPPPPSPPPSPPADLHAPKSESKEDKLRDESRRMACIEPNLLVRDRHPKWYLPESKDYHVFRPPYGGLHHALLSSAPPPTYRDNLHAHVFDLRSTPTTYAHSFDPHAHDFELRWELCWDPFCPIGAPKQHAPAP